ncbi:DUF2993 domain-containing protein [Myxosarcina sp. GI1]|uniref:LmeA family phospholipid-binding protein n=1 Tax=Myxosarcina sp. GI1 TaxID=1541065 RepID=UPI0005642E70|nr:DUF2993 domain-containing protein [Myxosarcina sp. GI1]
MTSQDIGEQAISKAAEVGMESQLDESEELDVDVRTNPADAAQGKLDSVNINGKGLVMNKELRAEKLDMKTNNIKVNPLKAAFGDIEMEQPTDATACIVLTDKDIERAFNSEYIKDKLKDREVTIDGETVTANAKRVNFSLPGEGKISLEADISLADSETKQIAFTGKPRVSDNGNKIVIEDVEYTSGKNEAPELTQALLNSAEELLDLRNFELADMSLQLKKLDVQKGKMTINADARVNQLPQE